MVREACLEGMALDYNTLRDFYRNKKILVTGHTGFKGSWLAIWLESLGAKVTGISLPPRGENDNFVISNLKNRINHHIQDIRDFNGLKKIFNASKPDIVFHLAAQPLVLESYKDPVYTFETNILGTVNVLEASRFIESLKEIILITTDKVYENRNWVWGYREVDRLGGYDPYSASKAAAEIVINSYIKSFFNPKDYSKHGKIVASVRAGNVIGGGDWSENRIIPDFYKALMSNKTLEIRNPDATRPWQHVLDPLGGYLWLATQMGNNPLLYSGAWNFGPHDENNLTVKELINKLIQYTGKGDFIIADKANSLHEANLLKLDVSKTENLLGYKNLLNVEEALHLTAEWYMNFKNTDPHTLCLDQIKYWTQKFCNKNDTGYHS